MEYLKQRFFDENNNIKTFLTDDNCLLSLEHNKHIQENTKKEFVKKFVNKLLDKGILNEQFINSVDDINAWSIDFPSWHGIFDEKKGKRIFIIGSEPHIHFKYLQSVYSFNNERKLEDYLENDHPIFKFISDLLSHKLNISKEEVLMQCYLTDLFPLSPFRGNGKSVGSTDKLQTVIGDTGNWIDIRYKYAKDNLPFEVENVKPEIIITQGKDVFKEVIRILDIKDKPKEIQVTPRKGKNQFIRSVKWKEYEIISVPHIGSSRMRTFWTNNMDKIKEAIMRL